MSFVVDLFICCGEKNDIEEKKRKKKANFQDPKKRKKIKSRQVKWKWKTENLKKKKNNNRMKILTCEGRMRRKKKVGKYINDNSDDNETQEKIS